MASEFMSDFGSPSSHVLAGGLAVALGAPFPLAVVVWLEWVAVLAVCRLTGVHGHSLV